jgi:hypothetical protein
MGTSAISMAIFNSHVTNYQGKICDEPLFTIISHY